MQLAFFTQRYVLDFYCQKIKIFVIIVNGYIIFYHAAIYSRESPFFIFILYFLVLFIPKMGLEPMSPRLKV